ncbi:hypothetical protein J3F84DRAFT_75829 [Trichoderma pleuroticola]
MSLGPWLSHVSKPSRRLQPSSRGRAALPPRPRILPRIGFGHDMCLSQACSLLNPASSRNRSLPCFLVVISIIPGHALTSILPNTVHHCLAVENLGIATSDRPHGRFQRRRPLVVGSSSGLAGFLDSFLDSPSFPNSLLVKATDRPTALSDDSRPTARPDSTQRSKSACSLDEYLQSLDEQFKTRVLTEMIRHCTYDPILLIIGPSHRA